MTKREAAIVSAYTGVMLGNFPDMHKYVGEIMGRPLWTHEFASKEITKQIKDKSRRDFCNLNII